MYLKLGGIDQWVMIRGQNMANPVLVLLHGGPGFSETHFFRRHLGPLEKHFTLVYWDQRGSGKTFNAKTPPVSLAVDQFITDLEELVDCVAERTGQHRVAIFGHSWGSALGPLYVAKHPEKMTAYVGSGQLGDWAAAESASYAYALAEAERRGNRKAVEELLAIGPPPYSANSLWVERTWLQRFEGQLTLGALWAMARDYLSQPEFSVFDLVNLMRAFRSTSFRMWSDVSQLDLNAAVPKVDVPVFFFLGRRDCWVPPETSLAYFDRLIAPSKQLVWFEQSGHEPFVDEPDKFHRLMVDLVRPAVLRAGR
jgi:pimeloyl-ACP methyl ester carboxylesterase